VFAGLGRAQDVSLAALLEVGGESIVSRILKALEPLTELREKVR